MIQKYSETKKNTGILRNRYHLEDKFIILGVATVWTYKKGFEDFIRLADMLDEDCHIVLVGVEEKLRKIEHKNMTLLGMTRNVEELVEIYNDADVFVNLTYCDTFPTVNLEARACGLPVITYDTGGSAEAAGERGISVKKGSIDSVYSSIMEIRMQLNNNYGTNNNDISELDNRKAVRAYAEMITG